jgi:hypothetical protein
LNPFTIRTLLDGRASAPRYARQTALLAASWHAFARSAAPFEVWLIGDTSARLRDFLRELGAPLVAASPDPNDAYAKTANCISAAYRDGAERVLLLDNDTCFLASPAALAAVPEDTCAAAVAGDDRISGEQWRRIERHLGVRGVPTEVSTLRQRFRAAKRRGRTAAMDRLYVNAGVLLLPASPVFPSLWSREIARVRELFVGDALASDAVSSSCQAGLALAIAHHRRFAWLPAGYNHRPLNFALGDALDGEIVILHMTGDGAVSDGDGIEDHLDAYWDHFAGRPLRGIRRRIGEAAYARRRERLDQSRTELARLVREYQLDAVLAAAPGASRVAGSAAKPIPDPDRSSPVAIGGLGGSGTRVVAEIAQGLGVHIGTRLNGSLDQLWFALLLKRPRWFASGIDSARADRSLALFEKAIFDGLAELDPEEQALLDEIAADLRDAANARRIGAGEDELARLRGATSTRFTGCAQWGWKEPNSHLFLDRLAARYPGLRYVHVVRHGLDIAFSRNANQLENWGSRFGLHSDADPPDPRALLDYWIRTTDAVAERVQRGERILLLHYDALCAQPRDGIRALADFLGVPCPPARLDALAEIPQNSASTGRYRQRDLGVFSPAQLDAVRRHGFAIEPPLPRARPWVHRLGSHARRILRVGV